MSKSVEYRLNRASEAEIAEHLSCCDANFVPPLTGRVEINDYAKKIASRAMRFEAWSGDKLVGLVAVYCNDQEKRIAHITNASVLREWTGKGIASFLIKRCIAHAEMSGMRQLSLEVGSGNAPAIKLYINNGFVTAGKANAQFISMNHYLKSGEGDDSETDYNVEIKETNDRTYACCFDFDDGGSTI